MSSASWLGRTLLFRVASGTKLLGVNSNHDINIYKYPARADREEGASGVTVRAPLYSTAPHYNALYLTILHYTSLYFTYFTAVHCTELHFTALNCTALHSTVEGREGRGL